MTKYKDKKSSGCALCKPWKHGWEPKHKPKDRARLEQMGREVKSIELISDCRGGRKSPLLEGERDRVRERKNRSIESETL